MFRTERHPINPWIRNGIVADLYLACRRKGWKISGRILEFVLNTEISCEIPDCLFLPHPYGIIVGAPSRIAEGVTLMHQVTLGGKDPWFQGQDLARQFPMLGEGAYIGAGAKILGPVTVGEWVIVGANAVITRDVPPFSTIVGQNRIVATRDGPPQRL